MEQNDKKKKIMVFFIFTMFGMQLTLTVPWSEGGLANRTPYQRNISI